MSRFGDFDDDSPEGPQRRSDDRQLTPSSSKAGLTPRSDGKPASLQFSSPTEALLGRGKGAFAIALDASGSMQSLIDAARGAVGEIISRVAKEARRPVKLRLYAYRDYDALEREPAMLLEMSDLTDDVARLQRWLQQRRADYGGGNEGEAVEAALADIYAKDEVDAVLIAGDEPSNSRDHLDSIGRRDTASARELADRFKHRSTPLHAFTIGARASTLADFAIIAERSGGCHGKLDGGPDMIDMAVLAMLKSLGGAAAARRYADTQKLTENAQAFAAALLPPPRKGG